MSCTLVYFATICDGESSFKDATVQLCVYSASVRRTSMREKKAMSLKEAREEAQKLLESANAPADDDEDEGRSNAMNGLPSTSAVIVCNFRFRLAAIFCCGLIQETSREFPDTLATILLPHVAMQARSVLRQG